MAAKHATSRETERVLRARAEALAVEPIDVGQLDVIEVIEFGLALERYAFEVAYVSEIQPLEDLTTLPGTPSFIAGIVNVRGRVLPVIDIKEFFDLTEKGIVDGHQIVLIRTRDIEVGVLADTVVGAVAVPRDSIQASLPTISGTRAEYLKGVTSDRLIILDASQILLDSRLVVDDIG